MTGTEIKALRESLGLTARTLGAKLGVEPATVIAWEREELFPTKRHVQSMQALERGPTEDSEARATPEAKVASATREAIESRGAIEALADPAIWELLRKIVVYPELRREVQNLAAKYPDPAKDGQNRTD